MLEADYIFLHTLLESGDPGRLKRACTEMMRYQNEDGSWSLYPGGPGNISLSVKCYSAAKLMGIGPEDRAWPHAAHGCWSTAASPPAIPSPRCICARWASTITMPTRPFRRRSRTAAAMAISTSSVEGLARIGDLSRAGMT